MTIDPVELHDDAIVVQAGTVAASTEAGWGDDRLHTAEEIGCALRLDTKCMDPGHAVLKSYREWKIPFVRVGRRVLFPRGKFLAWLRQRTRGG